LGVPLTTHRTSSAAAHLFGGGFAAVVLSPAAFAISRSGRGGYGVR